MSSPVHLLNTYLFIISRKTSPDEPVSQQILRQGFSRNGPAQATKEYHKQTARPFIIPVIDT